MTRQTLYFLNFEMKTKMLKFKILQRMHIQFPAIQQNHQNSILFHETIPLFSIPLQDHYQLTGMGKNNHAFC
jgi:hypothetical protein